MFNGFLQELGSLKNSELSFPFRNQFKIKENFINPNSKHFDSIAQKLLSEEKASIKRKWDKQCKMMFIWIMGKFFQLKNKKTINPTQDEWGQLSNILKIDEVTLKQRWITLINPVSKSINWDPEEDEIIRSLMKYSIFSFDEKHIWTHIALELYNQNNGQYIRTPKQVRERWMNYLNPKLKKTNWSQQEDLQLLNMVVKNGKRWSLISSLLDGRTENQVKNRFKSLIQKIYKDEDDDDIEELEAIKEYLNKQDEQQIQEPQKEESQIRMTYLRQVKSKTTQKEPNKIEQIEVQTKKRKAIKDVLQIDQQIKVKSSKDLQMTSKQQGNKIKIEENRQDIQVEPQQQQQYTFEQQQKIQQHFQQQLINENNKKELSTPNTLYYNIQPSFQKIEELKNDQFGFKQVQQSPIQQSNQYLYQGFRNYQEEVQPQIQQTPVQMLMGQYLMNYHQNYNLISPFPQINQTPMVYTPAQAMYLYNNSNNPYNMGVSPLLIRSPYPENLSPNIAPQQQQAQGFWQTPQQTSMEYFQNEQKLSMNKLEFLQSNNLVDKWKQKRVNEKQNTSFQESFQSLDQ
ncbi:unnamed protein product (macronuclear) [Paramecium tetraurelia]|uniref:Homeodomain protein n=1 Tax=Paramecium tetraurelia TaxID=5888 RepID=A0BN69_PARTE|nr:uncharacterized protein GSPATT00030624001 [Paramecium tetraurelia]CAK59986.1 unnamed protein product [Paramecium tetraurelia]|eukprot:XP_001427384.1 hypothetical protein (macronuclear) [Paramecium tetraurelia strain d4-2]